MTHLTHSEQWAVELDEFVSGIVQAVSDRLADFLRFPDVRKVRLPGITYGDFSFVLVQVSELSKHRTWTSHLRG